MNTKIKKYLKVIEKSNLEIKKIQSICPHSDVHAKYESNTGNFDPMDDIWWITVKCLDCDKYMSFDSVVNQEEYRKFSKFVKI